jgi:hypothetical protein
MLPHVQLGNRVLPVRGLHQILDTLHDVLRRWTGNLHHLATPPAQQDTHDAKIKTDLTESYPIAVIRASRR